MPYKIAVCEKLQKDWCKNNYLATFLTTKPFFCHSHGRNFDESQRQASACLASLFLLQMQWVSLCCFDHRNVMWGLQRSLSCPLDPSAVNPLGSPGEHPDLPPDSHAEAGKWVRKEDLWVWLPAVCPDVQYSFVSRDFSSAELGIMGLTAGAWENNMTDVSEALGWKLRSVFLQCHELTYA